MNLFAATAAHDTADDRLKSVIAHRRSALNIHAVSNQDHRTTYAHAHINYATEKTHCLAGTAHHSL